MGQVIDFPVNFAFKVLFELPKNKILRIDKRSSDNCSIAIDGQYGTAEVKAPNKLTAVNLVKRIFPAAKIIETAKQ
jgi:hypothetical protein|tara:strand:+ start:2295 stop:2522 length:228 start_codon:yes stop_codon:yes gene_type:complete